MDRGISPKPDAVLGINSRVRCEARGLKRLRGRRKRQKQTKPTPVSSLRPLLHGHAFRFAFGLTASHRLNVPRPMSSASPINRPQKSAGGASGVQVEGARRAAMRRKAASRAQPIRSKTRRACFITFLLGLPRPAARSSGTSHSPTRLLVQTEKNALKESGQWVGQIRRRLRSMVEALGVAFGSVRRGTREKEG
jgi:hypothetical protein